MSGHGSARGGSDGGGGGLARQVSWLRAEVAHVRREGPRGGTPEEHECCAGVLRAAEHAQQALLHAAEGDDRATDKRVRSLLRHLDVCEPLRRPPGPRPRSLAVRLLAEFRHRCVSLLAAAPAEEGGERASVLGRPGPQSPAGTKRSSAMSRLGPRPSDAPRRPGAAAAAAGGQATSPSPSPIQNRLGACPPHGEGVKRKRDAAQPATGEGWDAGSHKRPQSRKLRFVGLFE